MDGDVDGWLVTAGRGLVMGDGTDGEWLGGNEGGSGGAGGGHGEGGGGEGGGLGGGGGEGGGGTNGGGLEGGQRPHRRSHADATSEMAHICNEKELQSSSL